MIEEKHSECNVLEGNGIKRKSGHLTLSYIGLICQLSVYRESTIRHNGMEDIFDLDKRNLSTIVVGKTLETLG